MGARRFENPLLPDARLRELYAGLAEARLLSSPYAVRVGDEAAWVAPVLGLDVHDLMSVPESSARELLCSMRRKTDDGAVALWCLPQAGTARNRLWAALGAAAALRGTQGVVLCFARAEELRTPEWKDWMTQLMSLPFVLVLLPSEDTFTAQRRAVIPVIPVDGRDAIAIYRVVQEALTRARTGGGAAVVQCITLGEEDPCALLGRQLMEGRVCTEAWLAGTEAKVRTRLQRSEGKPHR